MGGLCCKRRGYDLLETGELLALTALVRDKGHVRQLSVKVFNEVMNKEAGHLVIDECDMASLIKALEKHAGCQPWTFSDLQDDKKLPNLKMLFHRFDTNSDGHLDLDETERLLKAMLRRLCDISGAGSDSLDIPMKVLEDHYEIVKKLGEGGQGAMYLAKDKSGNDVCVKYYDKKNANAPLDDIVAEFELMKALDSPHVARTFEIFQDDANVYLANEPYFGQDLEHLVANAAEAGVKVTEDWLGGVFAQVLQGVHYLHHKGLIHCDIKEANIMVTGKQNWLSPRIVLIDFGLANSYLAAESGACGTPGYIPPETYDTGYWLPPGDIFSCGVVFYQIGTGQAVPFFPREEDGLGESEFYAKVAELTNYEEVPLALSDLSREYQSMLRQMLEKNFKKRPTADALLKCHGLLKRASSENKPLSADVLACLKNLKATNELHRFAVESLLAHCNLAQMRELNDLFDRLDENGDGKVTKEEAESALKGTKVLPAEAVDAVIEALGRVGTLHYKSFMTNMMAKQIQFQTRDIRQIFSKLDKDGDGWISVDEFPRLAELCNCADSADRLLSELDADKDGRISFDEFCQAIVG